MGHRRLGGYLREQEIAGHSFLRIDIPGPSGDTTQFYQPAAVYGITPTTEAIARGLAQSQQPEPVHRWELPPARAEAEEYDTDHDDPDELPFG
jgi:hypothetical protein